MLIVYETNYVMPKTNLTCGKVGDLEQPRYKLTDELKLSAVSLLLVLFILHDPHI